MFIIISQSGFDLEILSCDNCGTLDDVNICDFCDIKLCDKCCPDEISFHNCDSCLTRWYYHDKRYSDYYCDKNLRMGGLCYECGH